MKFALIHDNMAISSYYIKDGKKMNDKLVHLRRAMFDLLVRDHGRIHHKILDFFGDDTDVKGYLNVIEKAIATYIDEDLDMSVK